MMAMLASGPGKWVILKGDKSFRFEGANHVSLGVGCLSREVVAVGVDALSVRLTNSVIVTEGANKVVVVVVVSVAVVMNVTVWGGWRLGYSVDDVSEEWDSSGTSGATDNAIGYP